MKKVLFSFLVLLVISCNKKEQQQNATTQDPNVTTQDTAETNETKKQDTLRIDYAEHKNLLDILTLLPDSTMRSWGWSKKERIEFVKEIQKNKFTTGAPEHFSSIKLAQPNTIEIQVVDGLWIFSIYKIKPNNYIVITDDIVGDGNDLLAFEYKDGVLEYIPFENVFDNFLTALLINKDDKNCIDLLEENNIGFQYLFTGTKKIEIANLSLTEGNNECFKGNSLNYEFNPALKKFELKIIK
ncbi:hypothetical protein [Flavobacterium hercynium]|uniref:Lipoprotein n=1 Tax=Flavobacterium hercynium TaxID=387094 RepID=A0A226H1D3_9FLAO|nr:hypothetical protein [Flavobacterium hercynium]OXA87300.1 hypothetical protein B0A66_16955 [Flavobacterium hercynium]SMP19792.1 hypothetical protein SAMN06265346_10675 [Flavobacterium hercynium]